MPALSAGPTQPSALYAIFFSGPDPLPPARRQRQSLSGTDSNIKNLIVAKQPFKTVEENAALYQKLEKEKKAKP